MNYFQYAKPVWTTEKDGEMNITCVFSSHIQQGEWRLKLTACNVYRVFINGKFSFYGPARGAHGYARVDEYIFTAENSDNTVVIEVAGYRAKNYYLPDEQPFLQAELCHGEDIIATGTDRDFKCELLTQRKQKVSRFSYQRPFAEAYDYPQNPFDYYFAPNGKETPKKIVEGRKLLDRNISYPAYIQEEASLIERGITKTNPEAELHINRYMVLEELKIFPREAWESKASDILSKTIYEKGNCLKKATIEKEEYALYKLPYSYTGFIGLQLKIKKDARILVLFDEIDYRETIKEDEPINVCFFRNDTYNIIDVQAKEGDFDFLAFEPYTAQFIKLVVLEGEVEVRGVSLLRYENALAQGYQPSPKLSKTHQEICWAAMRTFAQNALDILTDCPSRERAGWLCDSWFSARAEKLFTGKNEVERNFLENIALTQADLGLPEGMVPMCYPADSPRPEYIPNWSLWWLLELEDNYLRTGDRSLAGLSREKVYKLLQYFARFENEEGLLENLEGWIFVEWSEANNPEFICGVNYPSNMTYALALEKIGKLYGDESLIAKGAKIKDIIRKQAFDGEFFNDNATRKDGKLCLTGNITETCQYYAFFTGVATVEEYPTLWNTLLKEFGPNRKVCESYPKVYKSNAFIGNYLRLILLDAQGLRGQLIEESTSFFAGMAAKTGTLWEHDRIQGSLNHGFASYIAVLLEK